MKKVLLYLQRSKLCNNYWFFWSNRCFSETSEQSTILSTNQQENIVEKENKTTEDETTEEEGNQENEEIDESFRVL